ncbi:secreted RxLR effector protein 161-like [Rutidosis leptorrhynchoides]|uniref:secreted RxLR effector protein 161-like n=1 Tax=Rutidosis leptorrhynchoides TaxID=125765 RepID=UPI003A99AC4C
MTCTRPDIAFAVGKLSRFKSNSGSHHWQVVNRVFKYLKLTKDFSITYTEFPSILEGYSDASWITNVEDHSTTTDWIFLLGGGAISGLLRSKHLIPPIGIHCDSAPTVAKAHSHMYNGKSRHLGVRHSMKRELITNGVISIDFVRSKQNLANHLTKGLARELVHKSAIDVGLKSI